MVVAHMGWFAEFDEDGGSDAGSKIVEDNPEIDPVKTPGQYVALMRAVAERNRRLVEKLRQMG